MIALAIDTRFSCILHVSGTQNAFEKNVCSEHNVIRMISMNIDINPTFKLG